MKKVSLVLAVLAVAVWAAPAATASVAVTFTSVDNSPSAVGYDMGWSFQPTTNLTLTALGYYDPSDSGLTLTHQVAIYSGNYSSSGYDASTAKLVAIANVAPGDSATTDHYLWHTLAGTPVVLTAGTIYTVSSSGVSIDINGSEADRPCNGALSEYQGLSLSTDVNYLPLSAGATTGDINGLADPLFYWPGTVDGWFQGNFQYEGVAVPEPATMSLLGLGLAGLVLRRRSRK